MARTVVGVDASPGALRALAAPLYFRSRGGFTKLLLGSVSHAAGLHALCPVVVPSGAEDRKPAAPPRVAGPEAHP